MTSQDIKVDSVYKHGQIDVEGWDKAFRAVKAIAMARPEDVWPRVSTQQCVAQSALALCRILPCREAAPSVVYQLPDGNIVLEWRMQDGRILRYEVVEDGSVESMLSFADEREPEFGQFHVAIDQDEFQKAADKSICRNEWRGGLNDFQLAA